MHADLSSMVTWHTFLFFPDRDVNYSSSSLSMVYILFVHQSIHQSFRSTMWLPNPKIVILTIQIYFFKQKGESKIFWERNRHRDKTILQNFYYNILLKWFYFNIRYYWWPITVPNVWIKVYHRNVCKEINKVYIGLSTTYGFRNSLGVSECIPQG